MKSLITPLRFSPAKGTLCPSRDVFETVGWLAFDQLSNLRHRGAFTTVSSTFTTCCQMAQDARISPPTNEGQVKDGLLMSWYKVSHS